MDTGVAIKMYLVTYTILTILLVVYTQELRPNISFSNAVLTGTKQVGGTLYKLLVGNFQSCIHECLERKRCKSVNFITRMKLCELNYKANGDDGTVLTIETRYWYSEVRYWNDVSTMSIYHQNL